MIYQGHFKPLASKFDNRLYFFNDYIVFVCTIHLMFFTKTIDDILMQYYVFGWTFQATCAVLTAVNLPIILWQNLRSINVIYKRNQNMKADRLKHQKAIIEQLLEYTNDDPKLALEQLSKRKAQLQIMKDKLTRK